MSVSRRYPVGAEIGPDGEGHFRVWAPIRKHVAVVIDEEGEFELTAEGGGFFSTILDIEAGARYRFRLDGGSDLYPDPASRFQPDGPHGPSQLINPWTYRWSDMSWKG